MDFTEGQRKLLAYWGSIRSAVEQRVSTAELWATVRDAAAREGVELRGVGAIDMGRLRSIAAQQRTAASNLNAASGDQAIVGSMIASDLSARPPQAQLLAPSWIARFEQHLLIDGDIETVWRSSIFEGSLPATVNDLRDILEGDAAQLLESSSGGIGPDQAAHAGVGQIQISAV